MFVNKSYFQIALRDSPYIMLIIKIINNNNNNNQQNVLLIVSMVLLIQLSNSYVSRSCRTSLGALHHEAITHQYKFHKPVNVSLFSLKIIVTHQILDWTVVQEQKKCHLIELFLHKIFKARHNIYFQFVNGLVLASKQTSCEEGGVMKR